jgi:hypothetical protein
LPNDVATETTGIKCRCPLRIGRPDGVFQFLDSHFAGLFVQRLGVIDDEAPALLRNRFAGEGP